MIAKLLLVAAGFASAAALICAQDIPFTETDRTIDYPVQMMMQGEVDSDGYPDFLFGLRAGRQHLQSRSDLGDDGECAGCRHRLESDGVYGAVGRRCAGGGIREHQYDAYDAEPHSGRSQVRFLRH